MSENVTPPSAEDGPHGPEDTQAVPSAEARSVGSGRYVLGDLLGSGGMAEVYRAVDQTLGRQVAVKLLRDRAPDPTDRARFVAEARTLARLNHPNLVTILDAGTTDEHPFLVLELVVGASLSEHLRTVGPRLPIDEVAELGASIASGLAHCHAAGIVHRDVKPGNILLGSDGRALLTDFGISRLLDGSMHHTQTGLTIGTASYLAPEQVRGAEITPAVDMYALGLVLLEAITGRREYSGTPVEAALARLHRRPVIPTDIPADLAEALAALTQTDPTLRLDALDAAVALAALSSADVTTRSVRVVLPPSPAAEISDVATAGHLPGRFADAGAAQASPSQSFESLTSGEPPSARRRLPTALAALGWGAALAASIALLLSMRGTPVNPSPPPSDSTRSTSTPEKPVAAEPSPSVRASPATNSAPATTRSARTATSTNSTQSRRTTGSTKRSNPSRTKTTRAKPPAKVVKAHGAAKGKGKSHGKKK
jgi:serine/threonine protein kinase